MPPFYTIPQAARICSVNRSTMHRWVAAGRIKAASTPGGHKRILARDLKNWMAENGMPFEQTDAPGKKTRILIVDDDRAIRRYLTRLLNGIRVETETASDGFEAGKKLIRFKPDLMILDLSMPGMDGFEVCRSVKSDPETRDTRILILTGHGTPENREKALSIGAEGFLTKPSSRAQIVECIEALLA